MSNYAVSCPHCGRKNSAAPEAILLQEQRDDSSSVPQQASELRSVAPSSSVASEERQSSDETTGHRQRTKNQWLSELRDEWNSLTSGKKTALQMLFGFALLVGVVLFVYGLVS
ncbi:MAG: hypothetical protein NPIRA05_11760 [Nitrospirales bacterium]|nr:MAG: hypothetical protein NPIRA05_11760 [Nitrospirales bacterium]